MTLNEALEQVQQDIARRFNGWLASRDAELPPLTFHDDAPDITDTHFMGIYLTSPDGEVYTGDGRSESITVTLDCIVDADRRSVNLPQRYLSWLLEYLKTRRYGIGSQAYTAVISRVDLDDSVNAFAVALRVVTGYAKDCDL